VGVFEERGKLLPLVDAFAATLPVDVLAHYGVASVRAPGAKLPKLVFRVLTFVFGAHPGVNRNAHSSRPPL